MGAGQGNIQLISHLIPGGGGGVAGAANGLTLVGPNVELGGANPLLHNTQIEMNGFLFRILEGGDQNFSINPNTEWLLGDISGVGNGTFLQIDDPQQLFQVNSGGGQMLVLDQVNGLYQVGDSLNINNGSTFTISDPSQTFSFSSNGGGSRFLNFDPTLGSYIIGDIDSFANNFTIEVNDNLEFITMGSNTLGQSLVLDNLNQIFTIGDVGGVIGNGSLIQINDFSNVINIANTAMNLGININGVAGFTGTVTPVTTITVNNGIVTNVA